jgi:hypothetical protein
MISRHVDIVAVGVLLLGILVYSEARKAIWVRVMKSPARVRVERIYVRVPEPPVAPVVFK